MSERFIGVLLALSFCCIFIPAQEESQTKKKAPPLQHEITVTANRIESRLDETASSVTVITREELDKLNKTTVLEALEVLPGLSTFQNGPTGSAASILIRGANSEHTKVLLDGIELNEPMSPSRSCNLAHILIEDVNRIEVIRGPQSTLYGTDALGGVVNIITRQEKGAPKFTLLSQGGTYNTGAMSASVSGSTAKFSYSLGGAFLYSEGFSAASSDNTGNEEKDGYQNSTGSAQLGFSLRKNLDLSISIRAYKTRSEIDSFGSANFDDPNNVENNRSLIIKAGLRGLYLQNRWESRLDLVYTDFNRSYDNPIDEWHPWEADNSEYKSMSQKLAWQNNFFLSNAHTVTAGLEYQQEQGESAYHSESLWGPFDSIFSLRKAHNTGIYIQDRLQAAKSFFATLGGRFDWHSRSGSSFTFRLAPSYWINQTNTRIKATLGTGFKAPSLYQLFAPKSTWGPVGNDKLAAERSIGWDLGIEQNLLSHKLLLSITYFSNSFKNLIDFDYSQGFINIGKATTDGMEISITLKPSTNLKILSFYTLTKAKDQDTYENLLRRPRHQLSSRIFYRLLDRIDLAMDVIYTGAREDTYYSDFATQRITLDSYLLFNSSFTFELSPTVKLFLRMNNILNQQYELIKGYQTPGFSVFGGIKLQLGESGA